MSPKSPPFNFLIFCKRTNVRKSQRVPFFRIFGTMRLFKILIFFQKFFRLPYFFQKFFNVPKASFFQFFDILQQNECYKILKGPFFTFFGTMRLSGNFKKFEKVRKIFSQFLVFSIFFLWDFLKICFHRSPCSIFTRNETFCERTPQGFATYRRPSKMFSKNFEIFFSIFCLRFSVEKEWVFCCFQLGKNGFRGLRVSLRVFFGAVKWMKF